MSRLFIKIYFICQYINLLLKKKKDRKIKCKTTIDDGATVEGQ